MLYGQANVFPHVTVTCFFFKNTVLPTDFRTMIEIKHTKITLNGAYSISEFQVSVHQMWIMINIIKE